VVTILVSRIQNIERCEMAKAVKKKGGSKKKAKKRRYYYSKKAKRA